MLSLLSRIPVKNHKALMKGLLAVALFTGMMGLIACLGFAESTNEKCTGHLFWEKCVDVVVPMSQRVTFLVIGVALLSVAAVCALAALRLATLSGHLNRYVAILRGVETMSIQQIADITKSTPGRARDEIQRMIDSEMITDVYIDYSNDRVVSKKFIPQESHKTVVKCSECGGNNELIVGITRACSFCGQPLLLENS
jgi:hypothetical protein